MCSNPLVLITARKTMFSFSKFSEKMAFLKKTHWNMIFLVSSGKMIFHFSGSMMLFFRRKMEDDLSQKIHANMIFSSNVLKRWSFQTNRTRIWFSLHHQERWHLFFSKIWYFFLSRKMKDTPSMVLKNNRESFYILKKCMEIWRFLHIR